MPSARALGSAVGPDDSSGVARPVKKRCEIGRCRDRPRCSARPVRRDHGLGGAVSDGPGIDESPINGHPVTDSIRNPGWRAYDHGPRPRVLAEGHPRIAPAAPIASPSPRLRPEADPPRHCRALCVTQSGDRMQECCGDRRSQHDLLAGAMELDAGFGGPPGVDPEKHGMIAPPATDGQGEFWSRAGGQGSSGRTTRGFVRRRVRVGDAVPRRS